jgi:acyl-CoA dehydrogenase
VDLFLTEEERMLRESVRSYLDAKVAPLVAAHERDRTFPWDRLAPLYDLGYVRGVVAARDGGDAAGHLALAVLMEEAGRCWGSLRTTLNVQTMVASVLSRFGTAGQKERFLTPMLAGRRFGWFGVTESEAGSDAGALRTTGRPDGTDLVVTGRKLYITNALHADFGLLLIRVAGTEGLTMLLVDRDESAYAAYDVPHLPVRATTSCELVFDGTRVPSSNVVGEVGRGLAVAMSAVNLGRLNMSMGAVGLAQACLEASISFATTRVQFGRPIAGFQLVQQMVVEIATLTETGRLLGYKAAKALDAGRPGRYECSMAKYHCGEAAGRAASLALQVHGGAGLMEDSPVERYFRDAREATIPEGTSQLQILHMGKELLGVSAMR